MAELNVEPKKSSPWPWIIGIIIVLIILFFVFRSCNNNDTNNNMNNVGDTTSEVTSPVTSTATTDNWDSVDFNAPLANYDEITSKDVEVRENDNYAIYGVNENILFDLNKSTLRPEDKDNLGQIAASIKKRYDNHKVRIYGFTDSLGSASYNKQLGMERADAVQGYLVQNANLDSSNITLHSLGENYPVATNSTPEGRQENRRVEIVVKK